MKTKSSAIKLFIKINECHCDLSKSYVRTMIIAI